MRVADYPKFLDIIRDFGRLLSENPQALLYRRDGEPDPETIPLHFKPAVAEKTVEKMMDARSCTRCRERLSYKPGQFETTRPTLPYLILVHNRVLRKQEIFFQNSAENDLFEKIITGTTGHHPREFLIREALRCHFMTENKTPDPQWFRNCSDHLQADIVRHNIRGMLVMGEAATILVPEREKLLKLLGQVVEFAGIPTVFTPGPSRLVFLQQKNRPAEEILAEKKKIFAAVSLFKKEVMGGM